MFLPGVKGTLQLPSNLFTFVKRRPIMLCGILKFLGEKCEGCGRLPEHLWLRVVAGAQLEKTEVELVHVPGRLSSWGMYLEGKACIALMR